MVSRKIQGTPTAAIGVLLSLPLLDIFYHGGGKGGELTECLVCE